MIARVRSEGHSVVVWGSFRQLSVCDVAPSLSRDLTGRNVSKAYDDYSIGHSKQAGLLGK